MKVATFDIPRMVDENCDCLEFLVAFNFKEFAVFDISRRLKDTFKTS